MDLTLIHDRLANAAVMYALALGLWGVWRFARHQQVSSDYWGALVIAEVLIALQAVVGAVLWLEGHRPDRGIHLLYGIVSLLVVPAVYAFTQGRGQRRDMLVYGVSALILAALLLRAIVTGGR